MKRQREPRTADEFYAMSPPARHRWIRKTHAVTDMRNVKLSRVQAAKKYGIDARTLPRSALRKRPNGRYVTRTPDHLLRIVNTPTEHGLTEVATRDSRQASKGSRYSNALQWYVETGDSSKLHEFDNDYIIDASGNRIPLLTDTAVLDRLAAAGVLSFESFYAGAA